MRIAILGTRGVPNNYGGFERCAEKMAPNFVDAGHEVTVYNPSSHPYKKDIWKGVKIKRVFFDEARYGVLGLMLYDFLCLKDALKCNYDIILEFGYAPCALYYFMKGNSRAKIVTSMDGLDWKRSKWNRIAKKVLKVSEGIAVRKSDVIIADNLGIKNYLDAKYSIDCNYSPNGTDLFDLPTSKVLDEFGLEKYRYNLVITRLVPENNLEMILDGYIKSQTEDILFFVGPLQNSYGSFLKKKYGGHNNIRFNEGIYDFKKISSLRWYSKLYFHGHCVGGTNPSLLDAMASNALICAHDNEFNRNVLGSGGYYFADENAVAELISSYDDKNRNIFIKENRKKVQSQFNWEIVSQKYLNLFTK